MQKTASQRKCHNALYIRRSSRSPPKCSWLLLQSYSLDSRGANFTLSRYMPTESQCILRFGSRLRIRGQFLADILRSHVVAERPNSSRRASFTGLWMHDECKLLSVPRNRTRYFRYYCSEETSGLYRRIFGLPDLFTFKEYYNYHFFVIICALLIASC